MRLVRKLSPFLLILLSSSTLIAQATPAAADTAVPGSQIAQLQQQIADAKGSADNAWMLMCSALVLLMTGPGLALFYGGLVRKKNVLATMMQSFAMMALVTVLWAIIGYSLCFGSGTSFIGGVEHAFLHGVGAAPDADYAATIPQQTFMIYQLMFAIITPALICGAFAERMKFSAMLLFMVLWSLVVYAPMAHMVWGKGGLLNASLGGRFPTLDFAGGTVVHITSGVSALVCALFLGRRVGFPRNPCHPTVWYSASLARVCCGWAGSVLTQAAHSAPEALPPAHLLPPTSPPRPPLSAGRGRSGFATASPAFSAQFPVLSRAWLPSLPPRDSCSDAGLADWADCRRLLLHDGRDGESPSRL